MTDQLQWQAVHRLFAGTGWTIDIRFVEGVFTVSVTAGSMKYVANGDDLMEVARRVAVDSGVIPAA